jgi:hypothetical protein
MATTNPLEIIEEQTRERIAAQLRAKGREFAEALGAEWVETRREMALALVLDVCDPTDWVEAPGENTTDEEADAKAQKVANIHGALAQIVLDAAKTEGGL